MKKRIVIALLASVTLNTQSFSQEKETVKIGGVDNQTTISKTGMYGGTDSKDAKTFFDQAADYGDKGDFDNAKKFYLKAIKSDDKYVEAYDNIGLVYRRLGDLDKAIEYYKKSIQLYPNGIMAHQNLAAVYGMKKDYSSAIDEYHNILKISPNDPEGYFGIANSYMMLTQYDDALINAKKALELYEQTKSPHLGDGYYLIGMIYYYKGDKVNAKEHIQLAKNKGAKIHPKLEEELFNDTPKEEKKTFVLEKKEDYAKYETDVIKMYDWLLETPIGVDSDKRKAMNAFVIQWISGSPNVTIELSADIVTYMDCAECLTIFMGGWTKYVLETKDFDGKVKGNLAGTKGVIQFYTANKKALGKNKEIEKLIQLKDENKLEDFIKSKM